MEAAGWADPFRQWRFDPRPVGVTRLLQERERRGNASAVDPALQGHGGMVRRLRCESVLDGHSGCVNHLRWNRNGSLLASGSDDHKVVVWDYNARKQREVIHTGHRLNIFAVCFVPGTNDHIIASGAMDYDVRIHYAPFRGPDSTKVFKVHRGRVKDIASSCGVPDVFWTAAEDGLVYQFDLRALPRADGTSDDPDTSGIFIRLGRSRHGRTLRGMGMAVHPHDPTKVALACGDFYTRLYDRRMLRVLQRATSATTSIGATMPAEVFAPPHLHLDEFCDASEKRSNDSAHGTSIQFSNDGAQLLANYHNDHIYLFQIGKGSRPVTTYEKTGNGAAADSTPVWENGITMDEPSFAPKGGADDVIGWQRRGALEVVNGNYTQAIRLLSQACRAAKALDMAASFLVELYHTCAKAYLGRLWNADTHLAAAFCKRALELDADNRRINLTYIKALHGSKRYQHSMWQSKQYRDKFPEFASDVHPFVHGRRSSMQRNRQPSHQAFPLDDSTSESDESDESEVEREHPPTIAEDDEGQTSTAPDNDDGFWFSRSMSGQPVNCDVVQRYIGYCNVQTDIKEASFFGKNDAYIVAGSDDGRAFIWDKTTGKLVNAIEADEDIVNCVQPHPFDSCLATSGIESVIRLWTPTDSEETPLTEEELDALTQQNQGQMGNILSAYVGAHPHLIRLMFQPDGEGEGVQECATS